LGQPTEFDIGQGVGGAPIATQTYLHTSYGRLAQVTGVPGNFTPSDPDADGMSGTADHCSSAYDPGSPDRGGVGSSSGADGIGDACQCGDVDGDGRVTSNDGGSILAFMAGGSLAKPELCDVTGDGVCDYNDYSALSAALAAPPGDLQHCLATK